MKSFLTKAICVLLTISTFILFAPNVLAESSTTTFYPVESDEVLNNPFMGWVPWASTKSYPQPHSMVFAQTTWRELEPNKGFFDFASFESKYNFDYWRSQNKKILLQVNLDYPSKTAHIDIPDWLYNEIGGDGIHYDVNYGKGFSPNYSNPKLISYHRKMIEKLAEKYNNDSSIYMVVLGSVGHWGEWHTSQDLVNAFPKTSVSDQYVQPYVDEFTNKILSMRRPHQIAKDNNMGLHNNSIGSDYQTNTLFLKWIQNGYSLYLTKERHPAMPDFWKTAPSGGELTPYPGTALLTESRISDTLNQLINSHTSWIGPSCPTKERLDGIYQNNIDKVLKTIGYRFVLESISHPESATPNSDIDISMNWLNKGVAPFYQDWPVELSLADSEGSIVHKTIVPMDIRKILPGEESIDFTMEIPEEIDPGSYKLCVAILDPEKDGPGVDLAIEGRRDDGRYELDSISIASPISAYTEVDNKFVIEAEDYDNTIERNDHYWTLDDSVAASSGEGIMVSLPNNYFNVDTGYSQSSPQLDYNVYFEKAGRYYIWVRGYGADPSSDSLHIGIDGIETTSSNNIHTGSTGYRWCRYNMTRNLLYVDVETAGLHTINVYLREDGVGFDKLILVNNTSFTPSGIGPSSTRNTIFID